MKAWQSFLMICLGKQNRLRLICLPTMIRAMESVLHNFLIPLHLRYLRIGTMYRGYYTEVNLPSKLSRCYHLKILDLQRWYGSRGLPIGMSNLSNLCHFLTWNEELYSCISNLGKLRLLQEMKKFQVNKES